MKKTKIKSVVLNCSDRNSCMVSDPLKVVHQMAQITCSTPVVFTKRYDSWYMSISPTLTRINYTVKFLLSVCVVIALTIDLSVGPQKSTRTHTSIRTLVWITQTTIMMLSACTCTYHGPSRTRKVIQCLNKLQEINKSLLKPQLTKTSLECFLLKCGICCLTIMCVSNYYIFMVSCILANRDLYSAGFYVALYCIGYTTQYIKLSFVYTVLEGYNTLKLLNDRFENAPFGKVGHGDKSQLFTLLPVNSNIPKMDMKSIYSFVSKYDVVIKVVRDIDEAFQCEILMAFIANLIELVLTPYNLIVNIKGEMNMSLLAMQCIWSVWHVVTLVAVVEPCHRTRMEMDRTNLLVSRLISSTDDQNISGRLEKFALYLSLHKVCYSPLGMFTISRSLIASIAGSVTTYLVILVQFQGQDAGEF